LVGTQLVATRLIVAACVAVFAFMVLDHGGFPLGIQLGDVMVGRDFPPSVPLRWGALGLEWGAEEPFRRLAAVFVHFGLVHLGLNMLALVDFGRRAETHLGSARFLVLFAVTGFAGFWISDVWYGWWYGDTPLTAGASGSLFGLMGAEIGLLAAKRDPELKDTFIRCVVYAVIFALVLNVNNAAHVGGFVVGIAFGWVFEKQRRPWRTQRLFQVLGALSVALMLASLALSQGSPVWREQRQIELERQGQGPISLRAAIVDPSGSLRGPE
jgi:rhomboid protease GluP